MLSPGRAEKRKGAGVGRGGDEACKISWGQCVRNLCFSGAGGGGVAPQRTQSSEGTGQTDRRPPICEVGGWTS